MDLSHCFALVNSSNQGDVVGMGQTLTGNLMDYLGSIPDNIHLLLISGVTFGGLVIPLEKPSEKNQSDLSLH